MLVYNKEYNIYETDSDICEVSPEDSQSILDLLYKGYYLTVSRQRRYVLHKIHPGLARAKKGDIIEILKGSSRDTSTFIHFLSEGRNPDDIKAIRDIPMRFPIEEYASDGRLQKAIDMLFLQMDSSGYFSFRFCLAIDKTGYFLILKDDRIWL